MNLKYLLPLVLVSILLFVFTFINKDGDSKSRVKNIAFVTLSEVDNETFAGFKEEMAALGWSENLNINYIIPGPAGKIENLKKTVENVLTQNPDLIFVSSTPATQAVKKAVKGKNIPVLFCPVNDPVSSKIVLNLLQPEGMITGVRPPQGDDKRLEWLVKIVPEAKNILVPFTPKDDCSVASRNEIKAMQKMLNINLIEVPFISKSFEEFHSAHPRVDAVFLPRDSKVEAEIDNFVEFSIKYNIPLCVPSYQQVEKGALFAYGFIHKELGKEAAGHANKILRGVKTGDLPVLVGNSHLVINENTAKQIGVELSSEVLSNAKIVIK